MKRFIYRGSRGDRKAYGDNKVILKRRSWIASPATVLLLPALRYVYAQNLGYAFKVSLVTKKTEELTNHMKQAVELVQHYIPPVPTFHLA